MQYLPIFIAFLVGAGLGAVVIWALRQAQIGIISERLKASETERQRLQEGDKEVNILRVQLAELRKDRETQDEKLRWIDSAQEQIRIIFAALASDSLQQNANSLLTRSSEQLQGLVEPLSQTVQQLEVHVRELESKRAGDYKGLEEQLRQLALAHAEIQKTTTSLTQALKASGTRGQWGELQLRRVVEMAGLVSHVDFEEQITVGDGRPDMVVNLPNGGLLPVDAKAPMEAYLEAITATEERMRVEKLDAHAQALKARVRDLSRRQYWNQLPHTPELVVMFVPNEASLSAAFERDGKLLEFAMEHRVLIVSPVTLLALLKAVAYGWQQQQMTDNALQIVEEAREFYKRLGIFAAHLSDVGKRLDSTVDAYNKSIGSFEHRLLPSAERLRGYGVTQDEMTLPTPIDSTPRTFEAQLGEDTLPSHATT